MLVASPLGEVYTAESDVAGRYRIDNVPPGRYVPVAGKRGYDDALEQACGLGLCVKDVVRVHPGKETADNRLSTATITYEYNIHSMRSKVCSITL